MTPVPPAAPQRPDPEHAAAHDTAWLLVQIRWVAIASQFAATVYAAQVLGIDLPRGEMATVSALLVAFNLLTALSLRPKGPPVPDWVIAAQLGFDTLAGTVLLALSGGAQNPFTLLLLVPVMLAVSLCAPSRALPIYLLANACVWGLTLLPASSGRGGGAIFLAFILASTILSWFTLRLRANLAARAAAIEALRRERAEADQLVGLGLLASGMAHELGTPLTTLAVTLDDWADLGLPDEPARGAALSAMIAEVKRCREIVSRTLRAAGRERFEAAAEVGAETEFRRLLALWSTTRDARIDLDLVERLAASAGVPLVLHGSSSLDDATLGDATAHGITKVNISTHLNGAFTGAVRAWLAENPAGVDSRRYLGAGREAIAAESARLQRLLAARPRHA